MIGKRHLLIGLLTVIVTWCGRDVLFTNRRFAESRSDYTYHTLFGYQAFSMHNG